MANEYEIIIAGAGITGLTAALYSARLGRKTLLLTGAVPGGQLLSINRIDGYPGFPEGVAGYDLCPMVQEEAAAAGAQLAGSELQTFVPENGGLLVKTGDKEYTTGALIIATGTRLKELGVPGEEKISGRGVSHCASCDAPMLRNQTAAVVGGGDSALQEALTLADAGVEVIILHRGESLSAQTAYQQQVTGHAGINIRFNTVVEEILGGDTVAGVRIRDLKSEASSELEVSGVFAYIGLRPNTEFLNGLLPVDGKDRILTDILMRTNVEGILAAGTVRSGSMGQAVSSAGEGTTAAKTADMYLRDNTWHD